MKHAAFQNVIDALEELVADVLTLKPEVRNAAVLEKCESALTQARAQIGETAIDTTSIDYRAGYTAAQDKASSDARYNGWTNYETWLVKLWIDNDGGAEHWEERAREEMTDALEDNDVESARDDARRALADALKNEHDERAGELNGLSGVFADLMTGALGSVDWDEIASAFIDEIEVYSAGWNMPGFMPDNAPSLFLDFDEARDSIADEIERAAEELDITEENEPDEVKEYADAEENVRKQKGEFSVTVGKYAYWVAKA